MINVKIAATLMVALMMFSGAAVMVGTEDDDAAGTGGIPYYGGSNKGFFYPIMENNTATTPTQIGTFTDAVKLEYSDSNGEGSGFVITADGKLYGMGSNSSGQLGTGDTSSVSTPTQIGSTLGTITDVVCSGDIAYFITADGKLYGMGTNSYGQQGNGTTTRVTTPTQIGSFSNVTFVYTDGNTTLFIDSGKLYGMGRNNNGGLGTGDTNDVSTPTQIGAFTNTSFAISRGGTVIFIDSGKLYGLGNNTSGIIGTGNTSNVTTPTQIGAFTNVTDVTVSYSYSNKYLIFIDSGKLYGIGNNSYGQLGIGNTSNVTTPTQIGAFTNVSVVTASASMTYFIDGGKLYGTGSNQYGQIGNGTTTRVTTPTQIGDFDDVVYLISKGYNVAYIATPPTATVTVTPNDSDYGTVSPASITDIEPGDTITIANNTITYGETVVTATPAEADAQYTYAFSGFVDSNSDPVTGTVTVNSDMVITAVFTATTNQYAVTISPNDPSYGSVSPSSLTVDYGTAITVSGTSLTIGSQAITSTPADATAQYTFAFDSWTVPGAVETVTGPITITGTFTATVNEYTVTIESADVTLGTVDVSEVQDVPYGTAITVSGDTVTIGDTTITATVIGDGLVTKWSVSDGAAVTGDMTITASFVEPSSIENTLMGMLPLLLIIVLVITAAGGVFASGGNPEDLIKLIICLAVGVIIISVFVLPIAGGL